MSVAAAAVLGCSSCLRRRPPRAGAGETAAVVSGVYIYPVKSTAEISVQCARVTAQGFASDRVFQVVSARGNSEGRGDAHGVETALSSTPWAAGRFLTPRDEGCEKLFHVTAEIGGDDQRLTLTSEHTPGGSSFVLDLQSCSTTRVTCEVLGVPRPNDSKEQLQDYGDGVAAWLDSATGCPGGCRLVGIAGAEIGLGAARLPGEQGAYGRIVVVSPGQNDALPADRKHHPVSLADEAPFLLTNTASLDDLNIRLNLRNRAAVDMRRFRPNIVVSGLRAWEEDSWKRLRISSVQGNCAVEFHVWQRCGRCKMTTYDRDSLERNNHEPLVTMNRFRARKGGERNFGMHLIPCEGSSGGFDATALVHVDAKVEVLEYDEARRAEWERLFASG